MNKIIVILLSLMIMTYSSFGQGEGAEIDFKKIDFLSAMKLAKESNKMVFCNFSTTWCGPCKIQFKDVYSDEQVGVFMNQRFISLYIDSEAKEWSPIAKKYKVNSYPTMIVMDAAGVEKFRMSGALPKDKFIAEMEKNLDPNRSPAGLEARYNAGERVPALINDYAYLKMVSGDEKSGYEIVNNYFSSLSDAGKMAKENWFLYSTFALDISDLKAQYLIENHKKFYATIGEKEVDDLIYKYLRLSVLGYVSGYSNRNGAFNQETFDAAIKRINDIEVANKSNLLSVSKVAQARVKCELNSGDNFESFIEVCQAEFDHLTKMDCNIMISNFSNLALVASDKAKKEAIILIEKYRSLYVKEPVKGIDILERAIKELTPVKRGDTIDFMNVSLEEALKMADKQGKLVFIDCYTDWCGPCKSLAESVFTANVIKTYFDKNFINLKMNMEKGEGPAIAKRYSVKGYPTLLMLDGKGNVVHQKLGGSDVESFLTEFKGVNEKFKIKK